MARTFSGDEQPAAASSAAQKIFNRFMSELAKHRMHPRSVGFYAGLLHLTPKYPTTVIRKTTGRTAVEWIGACVMSRSQEPAEILHKSIQEVACRLNFPNQSLFGKYSKNHTGMPPPSACRISK